MWALLLVAYIAGNQRFGVLNTVLAGIYDVPDYKRSPIFIEKKNRKRTFYKTTYNFSKQTNKSKLFYNFKRMLQGKINSHVNYVKIRKVVLLIVNGRIIFIITGNIFWFTFSTWVKITSISILSQIIIIHAIHGVENATLFKPISNTACVNLRPNQMSDNRKVQI